MLILQCSSCWDGISKPPGINFDLVGQLLRPILNLADMPRDTRSMGSPVIQYIESHSDDVTEVCPPGSRRLLCYINEFSFNSTHLDPRYYYQARQMALLTYTTPLSRMKKMRCIKRLTTGIRYTMPIS
jgi:hypothetical protein